jgi:hypothetical protein
MWAVNGRSAPTGETTSNRQTHSFGLSTPVIDCAWVTARKSCTVYSSKTYALSYSFGTSCAVTVPSEIGRRILACFRQQAGHTGLYDGQGDRAGQSCVQLGEELSCLTRASSLQGAESPSNQVPSVEHHPLQRDNRIQPSRGT